MTTLGLDPETSARGRRLGPAWHGVWPITR